jgi:hypothetical protein
MSSGEHFVQKAALLRAIVIVLIGVATVSPACGGTFNLYGCGQLGSTAYQDCQAAMAQGEAQFLSTYTPIGVPWNPSNLSGLPSLPPLEFFDTLLSLDHLWAVISISDGSADDHATYVWHDGVFSPVPTALQYIDDNFVDVGWIAINDQGTIAASDVGGALFFSADGGSTQYFSGGLNGNILNDDNQLQFNEYDQATGYIDEYRLFDPADAPVPTPEPTTLSLLSAIFGLVILRALWSHLAGGRSPRSVSPCGA